MIIITHTQNNYNNNNNNVWFELKTLLSAIRRYDMKISFEAIKFFARSLLYYAPCHATPTPRWRMMIMELTEMQNNNIASKSNRQMKHKNSDQKNYKMLMRRNMNESMYS